ncbi:hypothetical protein Skr01_57890 [Sphaerisporangium krabiense]|uniref:Uncharacterized protein n=1 Tax=Sphaerisporangium krabiense TaxID=763782 RepID=A0A7W8Z8K4_9ACTN|nr:hypothetical protein [Sphaerisporangium krabiense]MBB5629446.1 hypothetical protein [Sphaerisporangium krabiense]GII65704.1 hypothetical protein Skr01_57890 [Sphaerisporangium krabiense]
MSFIIEVETGDAGHLRDLHAWTGRQPALRGLTRIIEAAPAPGRLGPIPEILQVVVGSGGALAGLSGMVIAWLNSRPGEVTVKLTRGEDHLEITSKGVKSLSPEELRALITQITEALDASRKTEDG